MTGLLLPPNTHALAARHASNSHLRYIANGDTHTHLVEDSTNLESKVDREILMTKANVFQAASYD